jgi:hypothetical protein
MALVTSPAATVRAIDNASIVATPLAGGQADLNLVRSSGATVGSIKPWRAGSGAAVQPARGAGTAEVNGSNPLSSTRRWQISTAISSGWRFGIFSCSLQYMPNSLSLCDKSQARALSRRPAQGRSPGRMTAARRLAAILVADCRRLLANHVAGLPRLRP